MDLTRDPMDELGPCPVCKKNPAGMGSTSFLPFEGFVCSTECGRQAKAAMEECITTPTYLWHRSRSIRHQKMIEKLTQRAVAGAGDGRQ